MLTQSTHTKKEAHGLQSGGEGGAHICTHREGGAHGEGRGANSRIDAQRRERRTDKGGLKTMVSLLLSHLRWILGFLRGYNFYHIITIHFLVAQPY